MKRLCQFLFLPIQAWLAVLVIGTVAATSASGQVGHDVGVNFQTLVAKAEAGDASSQNLLGALYQTGSGVGRDLAKAVEWYGKAADQDLPAAQANLGALYLGRLLNEFSFVEEPIPGRGMELLQLAAERGDPLGIARLGSAYLRQGHGEKAIPLLMKAVDLHVGLAAFEMGNAYQWGRGVGQDELEAKRWHFRSADMGYPAGLYLRAREYEVELAQQFALFQRAATGGHAMAQYSLAQMHEFASPYVDLDKAAYWYTKAALNGNEMGNQARFRLGLPDINGNPPVNASVITTYQSDVVLDDHTAVVAWTAAAGIALVLLTAGPGGTEGSNTESSRDLYCVPCNYEEVEWPDNQCRNSTTGSMRSRICY